MITDPKEMMHPMIIYVINVFYTNGHNHTYTFSRENWQEDFAEYLTLNMQELGIESFNYGESLLDHDTRLMWTDYREH